MNQPTLRVDAGSNNPYVGPTLFGKVLLVEDDPIVGEWIGRKLKKLGLEISLVHSKMDADAELVKHNFHAVITDIFLENNQPLGLKLVHELQPKGLPVIVISSRADFSLAKEAMNAGASYLFEKPFEEKELISALRQLWEEPRGQQGILERFLDQNILTHKEKEIVRLILKGLSNKEVAEITGNTEKTIKFHLTAIFQKCGVESRTELFNSIFPT